jgi:hypothetical protein
VPQKSKSGSCNILHGRNLTCDARTNGREVDEKKKKEKKNMNVLLRTRDGIGDVDTDPHRPRVFELDDGVR